MNQNSRLEKLRRRLEEKSIDALLVSQPENRQYLSGFDGSAGYLLITQQKAVLATDFRYLEQVKQQSPDYDLFRITGADGSKWFLELTGSLKVSKLGFEAEDITFSTYRRLTEAINKKVGEFLAERKNK